VSFNCIGRLLTQVYETQGDYRMVDTGHGRPIDNRFVQPPSSQSAYLPPHAASRFCPPRKRFTVARGSGRHVVDVQGQLNDAMSYVMDVKRALASQPEVYREFVDIVQRYHDQRRADAGQLSLHSLRRIVSLLRTRPELVLSFNEFLPDGYRIRMFDRSAYVIEYPDDVGGIASLSVAV